jgi:DNA-directed RNA polymerase subunit RPC12/RpoP
MPRPLPTDLTMPDDIPLQLDDLRCNSCGAPLAVSQQANYVTCQHCQAQLAVKRTGSAAYTEVQEAFTRETAELRGQVQRLTLQNDLTALDQSWERERERHLTYSKRGRPTEPSIAGAIFGGGLATLAGFFFMSQGGPGAMVGLVVIVLGIGFGFWNAKSAVEFDDARNRYRSQRDRLLSKLNDDPPGD